MNCILSNCVRCGGHGWASTEAGVAYTQKYIVALERGEHLPRAPELCPECSGWGLRCDSHAGMPANKCEALVQAHLEDDPYAALGGAA